MKLIDSSCLLRFNSFDQSMDALVEMQQPDPTQIRFLLLLTVKGEDVNLKSDKYVQPQQAAATALAQLIEQLKLHIGHIKLKYNVNNVVQINLNVYITLSPQSRKKWKEVDQFVQRHSENGSSRFKQSQNDAPKQRWSEWRGCEFVSI